MARIYCLQMPVEPSQVQKNLDYVLRRLETMKAGEVDFICLPEMWTTDFSVNLASDLARQTEQALARLAQTARELRCHIVGSALEEDANRRGIFYNTAHLISPQKKLAKKQGMSWGKALVLAGKYRKIHLFRPLDEQKKYRAGEKLFVTGDQKGKIGLSICYDLRFPELFRALRSQGAEIIFVPSAWPRERIEHWRILLKARAIENQVYMVGVNRVGQSQKGFDFGGTSMIVGPWGEVLYEGDEKSGVLDLPLVKERVMDLERGQLVQVRKQISLWRDRRPDLYRKWLHREKERR